ncbi:putative splicing factor 3A subunit 1-like [Apostichopus japonicus]|uniref:Putative splicing factor 3A subunit 1-like n=1 Tax=Stichopus japonicus TaxID=307972 RepID=A0A2G8LK29_STIJA|nr:putative splicing factor 3A subunit 1-like [Apostichopus japonicus]
MEEGDSDMEESDEEEEKDGEGKEENKDTTPGGKEGPPMPPPPLPPQPGEVQIRKDYDPKAPKPSAGIEKDEYLVSPITGSKIPADKMQEHMRIGLLDQRWMEQRSQNIERAKEEEVFAASGSITENLKKLAERRTDIFGEGDVETQIGKKRRRKMGENENLKRHKREGGMGGGWVGCILRGGSGLKAEGHLGRSFCEVRILWVRFFSSMESTTRKAQANISIEEQIEALHKAQGLLPDEEKERIGPKQTTKRREDSIHPPRAPPKPKAPPPVSKPPMHRSMPPLPPPPAPVT